MMAVKFNLSYQLKMRLVRHILIPTKEFIYEKDLWHSVHSGVKVFSFLRGRGPRVPARYVNNMLISHLGEVF